MFDLGLVVIVDRMNLQSWIYLILTYICDHITRVIGYNSTALVVPVGQLVHRVSGYDGSKVRCHAHTMHGFIQLGYGITWVMFFSSHMHLITRYNYINFLMIVHVKAVVAFLILCQFNCCCCYCSFSYDYWTCDRRIPICCLFYDIFITYWRKLHCEYYN